VASTEKAIFVEKTEKAVPYWQKAFFSEKNPEKL